MHEPRTRSSTSLSSVVKLAGGSVKVMSGESRGHEIEIGKAPIVVGSAADSDLVVNDPKVSRRHCEIRIGPYAFVVHDLGSRNGTWLEGARVSEIAVPAGAILRVGDTHLLIATASDASGIPTAGRTSFGGLVGSSTSMRRAYTLLEQAAACEATVLLGGETGTGKELAAQAIHAASARSLGPFEVFDCGAAQDTLLQSELFGHVRGAFSDALRDRPGVFERANGGTLFLDEIDAIPLALQASFLRACESRQVTRIGADRPTRVDVRIVAATRRDLAAEVVAGRFREDLYYRLRILHVVLPSLRARYDDLPVLCETILHQLGASAIGRVRGSNLVELATHDWPGNVRELRNTLERALAEAGMDTPFSALRFALEKRTVPAGDASSFQERKRDVVARFERQYLADLLAAHGGNVRLAARASGIERTQLKRLLKKHELIG